MFALLLFFLLLYLLLRIPKVQNWVADVAVAMLERKMNTKVELDNIHLNVFKGLEVKGLYVEDRRGDTLLYVNSLNSSFINSIRSFYRKEINTSTINLENAFVRIYRGPNDRQSNLDELLSLFSSDSSVQDTATSEASPVDLYLEELRAKQLKFEYLDSVENMHLIATIESLNADVDSIELASNQLVLQSLSLKKPIVSIDFWPKDTVVVLNDPNNLNEDVQAIMDERENVPFPYKIHHFEIEGGRFSLVDHSVQPVDYGKPAFDSYNMDFQNINATLDSIRMEDVYFGSGILKHLSARSDAFHLKKATASEIYVLKNRAGLNQVLLETDKSKVQDNIVFKYRKLPHWTDFVNKVIMDIRIRKSKIALEDILYWAPDLYENDFFNENLKQQIYVHADVVGRVNSLNARKLRLALGKELLLEGNFIARNLTTPDEAIVNAKLDKLSTHVKTLEKLIPSFELPTNFELLENVDFTGRFDGFFQDFVAYGALETSVGKATMDMRLNLKEGSERASYSGNISLVDFNMSRWMDDPSFGKMSMSASIKNGRGLDISTAYADLEGEIIAFDFKNHTYSGTLVGKLEQNLFDGAFKTNEDDISLDFEGIINFQNEIPTYNFRANIKELRPKELNLSSRIHKIQGDIFIDLAGNNVNDIVGQAEGEGLKIFTLSDTISLDELALHSTVGKDSIRSIKVKSEIVQGEINGNYILTELPDVILEIFKKNYPLFLKDVGYILKKPTRKAFAELDIRVNEPKALISAFTSDTIDLKHLVIQGNLDANNFGINMDISAPYFRYNEIQLDTIQANLRKVGLKTNLYTSLKHGDVMGVALTDVEANVSAKDDSIYYEVVTPELLDSLRKITIAGILTADDKGYKTQLSSFQFMLLNEWWKMKPNNEIGFSEEYLALKNVVLSSEDKSLVFDDFNDNKGIKVDFDEVDVLFVEQFIPNQDMRMRGEISAALSVDNIFSLEGLNADGTIKNFEMYNTPLGDATINIESQFETDVVDFDIQLKDENQETEFYGQYFVRGKSIMSTLRTRGFNLSILQEILGEGTISQTTGKVYAFAQANGPLNDLKTVGKGRVIDGATHIDYLGTFYTLEDVNFIMGKNYIDFSNSKLRDVKGNLATVTGGLTHENFDKLGVAVNIRSDNFILLNTDSKTNPSYYGFGEGQANVDITGEFSDLKLEIAATTGKNTTLTLPIITLNTARNNSFITIVSREEFFQENEKESKEEVVEPSNLTLDMFLTVTPDAEMTILFDPATGHLLRGSGKGEIQMFLNKEGEISMIGDFNVDDGVYNFVPQALIKKTFQIMEGGKVSWEGDPLDATIDIQAKYKPVLAPIEPFISEYIASNDAALEQAKEDTNVDLVVQLYNKLLNPSIKFNISFPTLNGELKSYADSKMQILQGDAVSLNNQVFGLLIFNKFISSNPTDNAAGSGGLSNMFSGASVVIGEYLSSQMSSFASSLMRTILDEKGLIYDVDFDFRLNNTFSDLSESKEYGMKITPKFNSDKIEVSVGTDYYDPGYSSEQKIVDPYLGGDIVVDYYLTEDKTLKLRGYYKLDKDQLEGTRRTRTGAGLYFKKDFKSLWNLEKVLREIVDDISEKEAKKN